MSASRMAVGLLVVMAGAAVIGVAPRLKQKQALAAVQKENAGPRRVRLAKARAGEPTATITLPATSAPFRSSVLYAKSMGYVRKNLVDVGDQVKAGQLLAQIDAPETAQEMRLAQARLDEAEANVGIATATADRASRLVGSGVVSQQQGDDTRAQANSAQASVATRKAELGRLQVLLGYQQIVAPFDGIVTKRGTDPGALVGSATAPLFEVADIAMLRVFVDVPDAYAPDVKPGVEGQIFSPRDPAHPVKGKVALTSGVLEASSRTLRTELHVPGAGAVVPGAFVYVKLAIPRANPSPMIPASALVVRREGTLVAKVKDGKVTMVPVALGRDFGKELEILEGVATGDDVVVNPSDELETGHAVTAIAP